MSKIARYDLVAVIVIMDVDVDVTVDYVCRYVQYGDRVRTVVGSGYRYGYGIFRYSVHMYVLGSCPSPGCVMIPSLLISTPYLQCIHTAVIYSARPRSRLGLNRGRS